jgi:hypothetical protein
MNTIESTFRRDANYVPITTHGLQASKLMTFAGGTTNDPGDFDGTGNPATLFSVTGQVAINVFGICTVNLAGASATIEVGTASSTAAFVNQQTATDVDAHEVLHDSVLSVGGQVAGHWHICDQNIIQTVGTANITAGAIQYYCWWTPLSSDGKVEAA